MDEEMVTGREQIEEAQTTLTRLEHLSNLIKRDSAQDSTDEHVNLLDQMVSVLRNSIKDEIAQVVPPNQKHHFVPQFYLRAWGDVHKPRTIHLYNLLTGIVACGPLKGQCRQPSYYGRMEKNVIGMSDNRSAKVISKIRGDSRIPNRQTYNDVWFLDLVQFVAMQRVRVPVQAEETKRMVEESLPWLVKAAGGPGNSTFEQPRPQLTSIKHGMAVMEYMDDLKAHLIVSDTDAFLTSDNPVFFYNQYNQDLPDGVASVDSHGFQAFCPLSPKIALVLYDCKTYELTDTGAKRGRWSVATDADVDQLNRMQAVNAGKHLYANTSGVIQTAPDLIRDVQHIRSTAAVRVSAGPELYVRERVVRNIGLDLSCFRIRLSAKDRPDWIRLRTHRHDTPDAKAGYGWQKALYEYSSTGGKGEIKPPPGWKPAPVSK